MLKKQLTIFQIVFCAMIFLFTIALLLANLDRLFDERPYEQMRSDFMIMFVPIYVLSYGFILYMQYRFSVKLSRILLEECDPENYLAEYDSFYDIKYKSIKTYPLYFLHKYTALIYAGRIYEARQIIASVPPRWYIKKRTYQLVYHLCAAVQYIYDEDYRKARQKMEFLKQLPMSKKQKIIITNSIDRNEAEILRRQGYLRKSRMLFNDVLRREKNKCVILKCIFSLGQIDLAEQNYDDARIAFQKVVDEGNKLYIVTLAKQELQRTYVT